MIKVSFKEIRSGLFMPAFDKLTNNPNLPPKVSYNISKIAAKVRPQVELAQEEFLAIVNKYAERDEKGEVKPDMKRGPGTFSVPKENEVAYVEAMIAFDAKHIEIDRNPLSFNDLEKANLAPNEWLGLEPLIVEMALVDNTASA